MADRKISQLTERVGSVIGADLLPIVGNVASAPTNFRVQVKNFLSGLAIDLPQTTFSSLKVTANVTANSTTATLIGADFTVQANSSINVTVQDRVGLRVTNQILNGNSNVTGMMWGLHVKLDTGNSNCVAANTFGFVVEHTIANTAWARAVKPRAYIAVKEQAGASGNATSYLMDIGAQGNTVTANTTADANVVFSRTADKTANRTLKLNVNGEDIWLLASNSAPA